MTTTCVNEHVPPARPACPGSSEGLELVLQGLGAAPLSDRRSDARFPFPYPICLTPVDAGHADAPSISVIGKHLSSGTLDFYYHEAIPYRLVKATLMWGERTIELLLDLKWCRFSKQGWYVNVGRILH